MKYNAYVIWDEDLELFSPIYLQRNDKMAIRGVEEMIQKKEQTPIQELRLTVYKIGEFDDEDSSLPYVPCDKKIYIWDNWKEGTNA